MTKQPYPEEFKIEAVKQITERGYRVAEVSARIGVSHRALCRFVWNPTPTMAASMWAAGAHDRGVK